MTWGREMTRGFLLTMTTSIWDDLVDHDILTLSFFSLVSPRPMAIVWDELLEDIRNLIRLVHLEKHDLWALARTCKLEWKKCTATPQWIWDWEWTGARSPPTIRSVLRDWLCPSALLMFSMTCRKEYYMYDSQGCLHGRLLSARLNRRSLRHLRQLTEDEEKKPVINVPYMITCDGAHRLLQFLVAPSPAPPQAIMTWMDLPERARGAIYNHFSDATRIIFSMRTKAAYKVSICLGGLADRLATSNDPEERALIKYITPAARLRRLKESRDRFGMPIDPVYPSGSVIIPRFHSIFSFPSPPPPPPQPSLHPIPDGMMLMLSPDGRLSERPLPPLDREPASVPDPPLRAKHPRECNDEECTTILTLQTLVICNNCHGRFCQAHCHPRCVGMDHCALKTTPLCSKTGCRHFCRNLH
jgi:hypothetical protein